MQRGAEIKSPAGPRWVQGLFSGIAILSNTLRLGAAETEIKMILLERLEPRVHLSGDGCWGRITTTQH
ncbi:MAG: hypothetical protein HC898_12855 [Phycisphaerales bacterium]|nr:hypothetical protein [Phycisphaerales bacterium]